MSLFPAYSEAKDDDKEAPAQEGEWLANTNIDFVVPTSVEAEPASEAKEASGSEEEARDEAEPRDEDEKSGKKEKREKKRKKRKKDEKHSSSTLSSKVLVSEDPDLYTIDRDRQTHYLSYKTLTVPIRPRYVVHFKHGFTDRVSKKGKEEKKMRYYTCLKQETKSVEAKGDEEIAAAKKTEEFNKKLCETSEVGEWLEFVDFQDEFYRCQHISYGSEGERRMAVIKKKLAILEKAISYNPKSEELQQIWFKLGSEVLSGDELLAHTEKMLEKCPGSLALWLNLTSIKQQSLALCTFPSVTKLYAKGVNVLQNLKTESIPVKDAKTLELLFHYCKLLDQNGQWEILWTILKNNMNLNLGIDLNFDSISISDDRTKELEDEIVSNKKQPIWVTWNRLETLREGVHFLPVDESLDYPQRCVSTDDIIDFILHFHRDLHFRLVITIILLLKVPLLPVKHAVLGQLFEHCSPWTLDSPELILSSVLHSPAVSIRVSHLRHVAELTRGPQYLKNMEGQPEFLELIQKTFQECMKCLEGKQKMAVALWWLRFNRWLFILDKRKLTNLQVRTKKVKHFFKDFMKDSENRDNLLFYCEYSLFEYDQGNTESSVKILKTLISSRPPLCHIADDHEKAVLCFVYKCLCEVFVSLDQPQNAVHLLINLGEGTSAGSTVGKDSLSSAVNKFKHIAAELIHEAKDSSPSLEQLLVPQFAVEWVSCLMWLLALTESTSAMKTYADRVCSVLEESPSPFSDCARENLWETAAVVHWSLGRSDVSALTPVLKDGLARFPRNLQILSLLASKQLEDRGLWWSMKQAFLTANGSTVFACVVLACVALERRDGGDSEAYRNRVKSLFQQILGDNERLSSAVHCLRLRFLFENDSARLDAAQMNAIESCPWNKSVYMTAVSVLPNKLMQLTDIMIEKEMRIHVTPDEIQEMRD